MLRPFLSCYRCFYPKKVIADDIPEFTMPPEHSWNPFELDSTLETDSDDTDMTSDDSYDNLNKLKTNITARS